LIYFYRNFMRSFFSFVVPLLLFTLAETNAVIWVQSSTYYDSYDGLFSTNFIGLEMTTSGYVVLPIVAGDQADANFVLSLPTQQQSSPAFFNNSFEIIFESTGTWWIYCALVGSTFNYDFLQIRVVPDTFYGEITPLYSVPPPAWENGYPPYASEMVAGTTPAIKVTETSSSSLPRRSSIALWLAPLLVGLIVAVIGITAVIVYKKGRTVAETADKLAQQQPIELAQLQPIELQTKV